MVKNYFVNLISFVQQKVISAGISYFGFSTLRSPFNTPAKIQFKLERIQVLSIVALFILEVGFNTQFFF
jgi:hypothetical protein